MAPRRRATAVDERLFFPGGHSAGFLRGALITDLPGLPQNGKRACAPTNGLTFENGDIRVLSSRGGAERRYVALRGRAYQTAEGRLRTALRVEDLVLRPITSVALEAFEQEWQPHQQRRVGWLWRSIVEGLQRTPARFSLSVWHGETLCGLAIGKPSDGPTYCAVSHLEGSPDTAHPLKGKVAACVLTTLEAYTIAIARGEMRLMNPLPQVVPIYATFGFRLVQPSGTAPYCKRTVPK